MSAKLPIVKYKSLDFRFCWDRSHKNKDAKINKPVNLTKKATLASIPTKKYLVLVGTCFSKSREKTNSKKRMKIGSVNNETE